MSQPSTVVQSPLVASQPLAVQAPPPIIVIGLPHCGISFLGRVISALDGVYLFDDLYVCQQAQRLGLRGPMSDDQLESFLTFLMLRLTKRVVNQSGTEEPFICPQCAEEDVHQFHRAMLDLYRGKGPTWPEVTREWLYRLARHHGCTRWGYVTPQDFRQLNRLARLFPGARFIYMTRDPRVVGLAFKQLRTRNGTMRRYHPFATARYWRKSFERYARFKRSGSAPILLVRYEDLVKTPRAQVQTITHFLGAQCSGEVPKSTPDTSVQKLRVKHLTPTEVWITQLVTRKGMREVNYILESCGPRYEDFPDLFLSTWRFGRYQVNRYANSPRARAQFRTYVLRLLSFQR